MHELVRTNDPVILSLITSLFDEANLDWVVFDQNMCFTEGSIGIFPKRVMVTPNHLDEARKLLIEAGLEEWVKEP